MAINYSTGNPSNTMAMAMQGLKDYYAKLDDPNRQRNEILKGYNNTLGSASSAQNTSNRTGARTGLLRASATPGGFRDNSFGLNEANDASQQGKLQVQQDNLTNKMKAIALASQVGNQVQGENLDTGAYNESRRENATQPLLAYQAYQQQLQDMSRKLAEQKGLLDLDNSFQPSGWDRFGSIALGGAGQIGGAALGNMFNNSSSSVDSSPQYDSSMNIENSDFNSWFNNNLRKPKTYALPY